MNEYLEYLALTRNGDKASKRKRERQGRQTHRSHRLVTKHRDSGEGSGERERSQIEFILVKKEEDVQV